VHGLSHLGIAEKSTEGPLSVLRRAVMEKERMRVVLRRHNGLRGHCEGLITMFDKHFNLVSDHLVKKILPSLRSYFPLYISFSSMNALSQNEHFL
jgi:small nuclear ribonucleoprotein (snRNP)-like protein